VADVVERRRVEDHRAVKDEQEVSGTDTQGVDVLASAGCGGGHGYSLRSAPARKCTTVSSAASSLSGCGLRSQWRWTAQNTVVSTSKRAAAGTSGTLTKTPSSMR